MTQTSHHFESSQPDGGNREVISIFTREPLVQAQQPTRPASWVSGEPSPHDPNGDELHDGTRRVTARPSEQGGRLDRRMRWAAFAVTGLAALSTPVIKARMSAPEEVAPLPTVDCIISSATIPGTVPPQLGWEAGVKSNTIIKPAPGGFVTEGQIETCVSRAVDAMKSQYGQPLAEPPNPYEFPSNIIVDVSSPGS